MFARGDAGEGVAGALADRAVGVVLGDGRFQHREDRLVERDVHDLPRAGTRALAALALAIEQGHQRTDHAEEAGQGVAEADARAHRRAIGVAGQVADAAERLRDVGEAGAVAIGAGLPVAGDADEDDARVRRAQHLVAEVPAFQRAGPEILNHHVAAAHEVQREFLPGRLA